MRIPVASLAPANRRDDLNFNSEGVVLTITVGVDHEALTNLERGPFDFLLVAKNSRLFVHLDRQRLALRVLDVNCGALMLDERPDDAEVVVGSAEDGAEHQDQQKHSCDDACGHGISWVSVAGTIVSRARTARD